MGGHIINLINKRFGRLLVYKLSHKNEYGLWYWNCICDCGNERIIRGNNLRYGLTLSCGCLQKERISQRFLGKSNILIRKFSYNDSFFENIDTEEKAYWLGFISADGNIRKDFHRLRIVLKITDVEHLEKFKKDIQADNPVILIKNAAEIRIDSQRICKDLFKLGVVPNKSLILEPIKCLLDNLYRHYWRGLIDGDGWCSYRNNQFTIGLCGTYNICLGFKKFISQTNILTKTNVCKMKNIYRISYGGNPAKNIIKLLYTDCNVYLTRKYKILQEIENEQWG